MQSSYADMIERFPRKERNKEKSLIKKEDRIRRDKRRNRHAEE